MAYVPKYITQPAFQTRRPVYDGDFVRGVGDDVAYQRFSVEPPEDLKNSTFITQPVGYDAIQVWWGPPADVAQNYYKVMIVRSGFGFPVTPADGEVILYLNNGDTNFAQDEVTGTMVDVDLPPGRWFYYSLLFQYSSQWYRAATSACIVPIDYAHRDSIWNRLTPFYQDTDEEISAGTDGSPLQRFFYTVGYDLDLTRTMAEGLEKIYDMDQAPSQLLSLAGKYNLGYTTEEDGIGTIRYRSLLGANRTLVDQRGTIEGLEKYVESITKYPTTAKVGINQMLLADDSEFATGLGHWGPMPYGLSRTLWADEYSGNASLTDFGTTTGREGMPTHTLSLETYWDPLTVPLPDDISSNPLPVDGMLKVTAPAGVPLAFSCGNPQKDSVVGNIPETATNEIDFVHMDPKFRGIPVQAGEVYYFSFWERQPSSNSVVDSKIAFGISYYSREPLPTTTTGTITAGAAGSFQLSDRDLTDEFVNKYAVLDDGVGGTAEILITDLTGSDYSFIPDTVDASSYTTVTITHRDTCGFSDAFWGHDTTGSGFRTFGEVVPVDQSGQTWYSQVDSDTADTWRKHIISVEAPTDARFAVPFIWIADDTGTPLSYEPFAAQHERYFTGMMFSASQGLGIEEPYAPNSYLIIKDEVTPASHLIGETDGKVLGEV